MASYSISPSRDTVHGFYSRDLPPILTIDSGDSVSLTTLNAGWTEIPAGGGWADRKQVAWYNAETDRGHALDGPIAIRGAEPGMTLEVEIGNIRPGAWGWSVGGGWDSEFNQRFGVAGGESDGLFWTLDRVTGRAHTADGHSIAMRPFFGVMGMPPDEPGEHATAPPRFCGGNIDCKELTSGVKLYLPISVPGALFSAGDGHAVQGDGEISGVAIECPMDSVELKLTVNAGMSLTTPRAWTPSSWITFGFDKDVNEAMFQSLNAMLDLIVEQRGFNRKRALNLASLMVDTRVTQIVNGVKGVHAVLPHSALDS